MVESRIEFEVETLQEGYEWLISFREIELESGSSEVYVVSICLEDINFEENRIGYIHIENIDYLYSISGGDERIIERGYDIFKGIESLVVEEIKSL